MRKIIQLLTIFCLSMKAFGSVSAKGLHIFNIPPCDGDATIILQNVIDSVGELKGEPAVIKLGAGDYNISRDNSTEALYHISNTASLEEYPEQIRHIGLLIRNIQNLTIQGEGTRIVTHGEMTPFVIDSCVNICLENLTITAADPTVTEIRILETNDTTLIFETLPFTNFEINDGIFQFVGNGWSFGNPASGRYAWAQVYYPETNVTKRIGWSPFSGYKSASSVASGIVRLDYDKAPRVSPGEIYQFRHWIRNEVGGFINLSKDITLRNVKFNYLGNFGLLSQYSENITLDKILCAPDENSGRTNAGFADFLHFSGCKGKVKIRDSYFCGAQDDGINIHGTHLKIIERESDNRFKVRFMHPQSFGFPPFFAGDEIEIVNASTLNSVHGARVKALERIDDYNFIVEIDSPISLQSLPEDDLVIENVTYTPEVEITGNRFERIPTRGILITTRKKSLIENNTFVKMPMASILVADDAASWYESGPVKDLTIRGNTFVECTPPNIMIAPEIKRVEDPVHTGIKIEDNTFYIYSENIININGADDVTVKNNIFYTPFHSNSYINTSDLIRYTDSNNVKVKDNRLESIELY